ncbi:CRISPR-associated protein [bacterium]|nr:CRISPR-associated protein [bacterium]
MTTINYKIEFFTDWNCSSGLTGNADIDIAALKDNDGFPYVPGKTVKGLLRDAAKILGISSEKKIFGSEKAEDKEKIDENKQGTAFFSNAELDENVRKALKNDNEKKACLFREIASTKIEQKTGVAQDKSLRKIEVVIPLTLFGTIECEEGDDTQIRDCMKFIKRLGMERSRGLGRCKMSVKMPEEVK